MSTVANRIYALWPSLEEMALDLDTSPNLLKRQKDAGKVPEDRHDSALLLRARSQGRRLTRAEICEARRTNPMSLAARRQIIGDFYERAGGVQRVSARTGVSTAHLYANKSKGWLNRTARLEYRALADECGFPLPDEIFRRPTAANQGDVHGEE